jgi:hypothetical protein
LVGNAHLRPAYRYEDLDMGVWKEVAIRRMNGEPDWPEEEPIDEIQLAIYTEKLKGELDGHIIYCASPGKRASDRSMQLRFSTSTSVYIYAAEGNLGRAYAMVREKLELPKPEPSPHVTGAVTRILFQAVPAAGTVVETYLRSRSIRLPIPPCLRFHPSLYHTESGTIAPAMVAERAHILGSVPALHRTWIKHDGSGKADLISPQRKDLGRTASTAIRLSEDIGTGKLLIGERHRDGSERDATL